MVRLAVLLAGAFAGITCLFLPLFGWPRPVSIALQWLGIAASVTLTGAWLYFDVRSAARAHETPATRPLHWILRLLAAALASLLSLFGAYFLLEELVFFDWIDLAVIAPFFITAAVLGYVALTGRDPIPPVRARRR